MSSTDLQHLNLLDLAPVRLARWEEADERIVLIRPRPRSVNPFQWLAYFIAPPRVRLDPIGTLMWKRLDGSMTVGGLAGELRKAFGDGVEPAEERLGYLIRMLRQDGFVGFPGWDD